MTSNKSNKATDLDTKTTADFSSSPTSSSPPPPPMDNDDTNDENRDQDTVTVDTAAAAAADPVVAAEEEDEDPFFVFKSYVPKDPSLPRLLRIPGEPLENAEQQKILDLQLTMEAKRQQMVAQLTTLVEKTGMPVTQENGQRRYGPPRNYAGPPPTKGTEIFFGKIPRDAYEPELVPIFERAGEIYEMRLMMDFSGTNRGYGFVQYFSSENAKSAVLNLNNYEIRPGRHIGVVKSVDNCRLYIGGIPPDKTRQEVFEEINRITEGVVRVIVHPAHQEKNKNRGFCFIEYGSHKAAAMARRKMIPGKIPMWGLDVQVDWAKPEPEPEIFSDTSSSRCRHPSSSSNCSIVDHPQNPHGHHRRSSDQFFSLFRGNSPSPVPFRNLNVNVNTGTGSGNTEFRPSPSAPEFQPRVFNTFMTPPAPPPPGGLPMPGFGFGFTMPPMSSGNYRMTTQTFQVPLSVDHPSLGLGLGGFGLGLGGAGATFSPGFSSPGGSSTSSGPRTESYCVAGLGLGGLILPQQPQMAFHGQICQCRNCCEAAGVEREQQRRF